MQTKEYMLPNGKKAAFQYDITGVGKVTLECMDELMAMIADRPQGEWIDKGDYAECSNCGAHSGTQYDGVEPVPLKTRYCPNCGAKMKGADDE